jgi:hypothetical protein
MDVEESGVSAYEIVSPWLRRYGTPMRVGVGMSRDWQLAGC